MAELDQILENFCRLDHVFGAAVFDANGFVIDKYFVDERETEPLAEVILRSLQLGMSIAEDLGKALLYHIKIPDQTLAPNIPLCRHFCLLYPKLYNYWCLQEVYGIHHPFLHQ